MPNLTLETNNTIIETTTTIKGTIIPDADVSYDIGSSTNQINNIYANSILTNGITNSGTINNIYVNSGTNNFSNALCITDHNFSNFSGNNNGSTIVGVGACNSLQYRGNSQPSYIVACGYRSSYNITTGCCTVCIGTMAGYSLTIAHFNTAIGHQASYNTTGEKNVTLGIAAGYDNTSGTKNIYIGTDCQNSGSVGRTNTNEIVIGTEGRGNGNDTTTLGNTNTTDTFIHGNNIRLKSSDNNLYLFDNTYAGTANSGRCKGMQVIGSGTNATIYVGIRRDTSASDSYGEFWCNRKLQLFGGGSITVETSGSGNHIYFWQTAGTYIKHNNQNLHTAPSDDRIKFNETLVENGLDVINKVNIYKYDKVYRIGDTPDKDPYKKEVGVIAQEIQQIPELAQAVEVPDEVPEDKKEMFPNGTPLSVWYDQIHSYHIKATQELHQLVKTQENIINDLNTKVQNLENENLIIKNALNELLSEAGKSTI
jgi:hypothetical protein